ncbi:hypothetical protein TNCV_2555461 [Trichonephila clavipes]|nr:hypothetical protein TNCV_2555461 [Trichonephila clavipes]
MEDVKRRMGNALLSEIDQYTTMQNVHVHYDLWGAVTVLFEYGTRVSPPVTKHNELLLRDPNTAATDRTLVHLDSFERYPTYFIPY